MIAINVLEIKVMRKGTLKIIDGLDTFSGVVINANTFNLEYLNSNHAEIKAC